MGQEQEQVLAQLKKQLEETKASGEASLNNIMQQHQEESRRAKELEEKLAGQEEQARQQLEKASREKEEADAQLE